MKLSIPFYEMISVSPDRGVVRRLTIKARRIIKSAASRILSLAVAYLFMALPVKGQTEYISISKSGPAAAIPGDLITYTISVGNGSQAVWTGTITDNLPEEFTFVSSTPAATRVGQTLTWHSFTVAAQSNSIITVTGHAGRIGTDIDPDWYDGSYYMQNSNEITHIENNVSLDHGTASPGAILTASITTSVNQICSFTFPGLIGQIKMSTGATFAYLVVIQNTGNVYDRYALYTDPDNPEYASCTNPDGSSSSGNRKLGNALLDINGDPLSITPWIAPGQTYSFYLELTTPNGTPAHSWNCTDLTATSSITGDQLTQTFHTQAINPSNDPDLNVYQLDYPDPVPCGGTFKYTIYIVNLGKNSSYNTLVTDTYDSYVEYISADPAPSIGNTTWNLGEIASSGYSKIDITARIKNGVYNDQQVINNVVVTYDNGAASPTIFTENSSITTTVKAYPDLVVTKTASSDVVRLGQEVTYTIGCSNTGCGMATGVTIEDDYDDQHTEVVDPGGGIVGSGKITFNAGNITPQSGTHEFTYTVQVTDVACGSVQVTNNVFASSPNVPDQNILNNSASLSILAISAPNWTKFPGDVTVNCNNVPELATIGEDQDVWAVDACDRPVTIEYLDPEVRTDGPCEDNYILTRTWRATDSEGNSTERSQIITVQDVTPPDITCPSFNGFNTTVDGSGIVTVHLEANSGNNYVISGTAFNATGSDNCDGTPAISYSLTGSTTGQGSTLNGVTLNKGITNVQWTARDRCNNFKTCSYKVIVNSDPGITITKSLANINGNGSTTQFSAVGDILNFNIVVNNTGDVTLYDLEVTDSPATVTNGSIGTLAPGESATRTAAYTITQNDLNAGFLTNEATVNGLTLSEKPVEAFNSSTVFAIQTGTATLTKTSTIIPNNYDAVGEILTYSITITNTGNVTLTGLAVSDPNSTIIGSPNDPLAPDASTVLTARHTVTQEDLDNGKVDNTASLHAIYHNAQDESVPVVADDSETILAVQTGSVSINKTSASSPITYDQVGDYLDYIIYVANTGNVTLTGLVVTDPNATVTGGTIAYLSPGQSTTISARHTVTQADLNAGKVDNTASVTGTYHDASSAAHTATSSDNETILAIQVADISVDKTSPTDPNTIDQVDDVISYDLLITNNGNVTLSNIVVTDPNASVSGSPVAMLNPGESVTLTATHIVTQADLDAGKVDNTASATGTYHDETGSPQTGTGSGMLSFILSQDASVTLDKVSTTSPNNYDEVGDILTYNIVLHNTGNVTLTNLVVTDPVATVTGSPVTSLAPGAIITLTASHTVIQADIDAEKVDNTASVEATYHDAAGAAQTVIASDLVTILALQEGAVTLDKTSTTNPNTYDQVGDVLTYNIILTNTGNVTLSNLTVTDPNTTVTGSPVATLAPTLSATVTASHTVTQANLNAGKFDNTANVSGIYTDASSQVHTVYASGNATVIATQNGSVSLDKTSTTSPNNYDQVGDVLTFDIDVTNTGNVTLTNLVVLDPSCTLTGNPIASLAPGASATLTASHTVTQADLNAGKFDNSASVSGVYRDASNVSHTATASDIATIPAVQTPVVTIDKVSNTTPNNFDGTGDILTYSITIRNTGNVTLSDLTVTDPTATVTGSPVASLAPGVSATLSASYTVVQSDLDAGKVDNTATVTGTYHDSGNTPHTVTASDIVTIPALQTAGISLEKSSSTNPNTYDLAGDVLTYNLVITNTGNVTLTNLVVTDAITTISGSPVASLAPGASVTLTAQHTVTQNDLNQGIVTNNASVTGTYHDASSTVHHVTATDFVDIIATQNAALTLLKTSTTNPDTYDQVGDILTYSISVTNTGNVTLTNIIVSDPLASVTGSPVATLVPGATANLSASHIVTQADLNTGQFINTASVSARYSDYQNIQHTVSAHGSETVTATLNPVLTLDKTASQTTYNSIGESITYTIVVSNAGNVAISDIDINDGLTGENWNVSMLAPGETRTFTTTYHVTQADLDAGNIVNNVSASGTDPLLNEVTASTSETVDAEQIVELSLSKTASPEHYVPIDENITYTINLASSSNINLLNIQVTDVLPDHTSYVSSSNGGTYDAGSRTVSWTISQVAPGETVSLQLVVSIDSDTEHQTVITNTVEASSGQISTVTSNDSEVEVLRSAMLWLVSSTDVACYGGSTGSATVQITGGMAPYTYTWDTDPVLTGPTATNLPAGNYTVHAEDNMGFSDDLTVTISQPEAALGATVSETDVACYGESTGTVNLQVTGGTAPYTFLWSNNAVTQNLSEVPAGHYTVLITDAKNCEVSAEADIKEPTAAITINSVVINNVTCIDDTNGSIMYNISGGTTPYTYLWNTGATSMYLENISGGNYQLIITDNAGCQLDQSFTVEYQFTDCEIKVPSGLTPNSQFDNQLIIKGLGRYPNNSIKIFNRYGTLVYKAAPYPNDWTGVPNVGRNAAESDGKLPDGTYFYILELEPGSEPLSGYIYLIKN
jgi:uncharacterized repeat protein (TIGR01451 family)/gliding motility-associated-like protein